MDYERDHTFANMYLGNEIRFDGLARLAQNIAAMFSHRTAVATATAKA